ncbi:MAG: pyruvate kinase [Planctomycetaceae bacterium]|nr:pyruvate kinase [Planctomycetaceae bacterium]
MSPFAANAETTASISLGAWCTNVTHRPRIKLRFTGTKVVCTLGPATSSVESIKQLIEAGATVFRLNFSHGTHAQHTEALKNIRLAEQQLHTQVAVLQDLCGPKIRVSHTRGDQPLELQVGQRITLTTRQFYEQVVAPTALSSATPSFDLATNYEPILNDVNVGEPILLNDGRQRLKVISKRATWLECEVIQGGKISKGKGINLPQADLSTPSVTPKDWEDLAWGLEQRVDFVALSFVRSAADIIQVRDHLDRVSSPIQIIAKIERPEALINIEEILQWSDGVMVARGDLAIETDCAQVPLVQKQLIERCRELNKPVITATQLLDSMVDSPMPTRAEVSDIANAVLDGTDALMLSNETAVGQFPQLAVETLMKVSLTTQPVARRKFATQVMPCETRIAAMVQSAAALADRCEASAIAIYTQSGFAARQLSSLRVGCPVIACTNSAVTVRQMGLSYGVNPVMLDAFMDRHSLIPHLVQIGLENHWWSEGDRVVVVASQDGCGGDLNVIQVVTVESSY